MLESLLGTQVSLFLATHHEGRAWKRWAVPWGKRELA